MKVSVQRVIIDRDMVLKVAKKAWSWEVPVLQEKYGDKVRLLDEVEVDVDGLPEASAEFSRLALAHGSTGGNGGTHTTFVELAYGRGKAGIDALRKAMGAAHGPKAKKGKKKVTAKKPEAVKVTDEGEGDPLAV